MWLICTPCWSDSCTGQHSAYTRVAIILWIMEKKECYHGFTLASIAIMLCIMQQQYPLKYHFIFFLCQHHDNDPHFIPLYTAEWRDEHCILTSRKQIMHACMHPRAHCESPMPLHLLYPLFLICTIDLFHQRLFDHIKNMFTTITRKLN